MKIRHIGTGTVHIEGFGDVASGDTLGVSDELGRKLIAGMPTEFEEASGEPAAAVTDEPAPRARQGRTASRISKGGGD